MARKSYYFTCCGIINQKIVGETFFVTCREDAYNLYKSKYGEPPSFFDGPFYRKLEKNKKEIEKKNIQLTNKLIKGKYKENIVKAVLLKNPKDYAYIILAENNSEITNNIVHVSEIREL